jgi:hypothetical protein
MRTPGTASSARVDAFEISISEGFFCFFCNSQVSLTQILIPLTRECTHSPFVIVRFYVALIWESDFFAQILYIFNLGIFAIRIW